MRHEEIRELPVVVQDYLNYLSVVRGKSDLTILEYASDLRLFFRFLCVFRKKVDPALPYKEIDISHLDISFISSANLSEAYAFLSYCLKERKNDSAARSRKVIAVRRFYNYLKANGLIEKNPYDELDSPKKKKALPKYLSLEQSQALLRSVDGAHRQRDYCILTLFLNCGLRLSELVSINISSISDNNTLVITGKGNKERTVYLNDACLLAIREYLRVRPVDGVKDRDALFISNQKKRISPKTVQHIVDVALDKSGLGGQGYSTHKLRHTAATLMYQYGDVDVLLLKEILGHENLSTTEIYTHVVDSQLKKAVDSNPLNKLSQNVKNEANEE